MKLLTSRDPENRSRAEHMTGRIKCTARTVDASVQEQPRRARARLVTAADGVSHQRPNDGNQKLARLQERKHESPVGQAARRKTRCPSETVRLCGKRTPVRTRPTQQSTPKRTAACSTQKTATKNHHSRCCGKRDCVPGAFSSGAPAPADHLPATTGWRGRCADARPEHTLLLQTAAGSSGKI